MVCFANQKIETKKLESVKSTKVPTIKSYDETDLAYTDILDSFNRLETELKSADSRGVENIKHQICRDYLNEIWLSEILPPVGSNINTIKHIKLVE